MIRNRIVQILLLPFSLLYGLGVSLRNLFYKWKVLSSVSFNLPVISLGNLTVGGAGKSPHVEYLINLLKPYVHVSTLSRGYKRKTKGFVEVQPFFTADKAGDEPVQFKRKHPDIGVFVNESRMFGIPQLVSKRPQTQVVLLDDAFQHLSVTPGMNILLTEYQRLFTNDFLLPSGRLREWPSAYKRADVMIVSKCPTDFTEKEKQQVIHEIKPLPHQSVFFSYYEYYNPYSLFDHSRVKLDNELDILLVSGIARTDYLLDYLVPKVNDIRILEFEDHHDYSGMDIGKIKQQFDLLKARRKIILTTEKDAIRLLNHKQYFINNKMNIFALPISVKFHFQEQEKFDEMVKSFLLNFRA